MRAAISSTDRSRIIDVKTLVISIPCLLLVAVLAAACSSSADRGVEDMAPIFESGPEVVEVTARSARV